MVCYCEIGNLRHYSQIRVSILALRLMWWLFFLMQNIRLFWQLRLIFVHTFSFWPHPQHLILLVQARAHTCGCSNGCLTHDIAIVTSYILSPSNTITFDPCLFPQSIAFKLPAVVHGDWAVLFDLTLPVFRSVGWCSPAACTDGSRWTLTKHAGPPTHGPMTCWQLNFNIWILNFDLVI